MRSQLARYKLLRRLAQSGKSSVYLARQAGVEGFSRKVVIKRVAAPAGDSTNARLLVADAALAAHLSNPYVAQVFDVIDAAGERFTVMEFVDGPSLKTLLDVARTSMQPLPIEHCLKIASSVCEGLAYAHSLKHERTGEPLWLVHADVTPGNILVSRSGVVKIIGFSVGKSIAQVQLSQPEETLGYLSPEQVMGQSLDGRSDVFSVGVILFEMLTGMQPFARDNAAATLDAIARYELPSVTSVRPNAPSALDLVIAKATAKDRAQRYGSAVALQHALEFELAQVAPQFTPARLRELVHTLVPPAASDEAPATGAEAEALTLPSDAGETPSPPAPPPLPSRTKTAELRAVSLPVPQAPPAAPDVLTSTATQWATQSLPDVPALDAEPVTSPSANLLTEVPVTGETPAPLTELPSTDLTTDPQAPVVGPAVTPPSPSGPPVLAPGAAPAPKKSGPPWVMVSIGVVVLGALFAGGWWAKGAFFDQRTEPSTEPGGEPIAAVTITAPDASVAVVAAEPEVADAAAEVAEAPALDASVQPAAVVAEVPTPDAGPVAVAAVAAEPEPPAPAAAPAPAPAAAPGGRGVAVVLKSSPEAAVWIDGAKAGDTPLQVQLEAGSHRLRFESPDAGLNKSILLRVPKGESYEREFTFGRAKLTLVAPEGATVFLGRRKLGTAPLAPLDVYEGTYRVHVVDAKRALDVTKTIEVTTGEVTARVDAP